MEEDDVSGAGAGAGAGVRCGCSCGAAAAAVAPGRTRCRWRRGSGAAGVVVPCNATAAAVWCLLMILVTAPGITLAGVIRELAATPGVRSVQLSWSCSGRCAAQILQYYESDDTRISAQAQPMSVITAETELLVERLSPTTTYTFLVYDELNPDLQETVNATTLAVQLEEMRCAPKRIELAVYTGPVFGGIIYVGGHYDECRLIGDASKDVDSYRLTIPLDRCANQLPNHQYETTVIVQEHINIATGNDLAMSIRCDYTPPKEKRVTSSILHVTDLPPGADNEAVEDVDRFRLDVPVGKAAREDALSASVNSRRHVQTSTDIEAERIEERVIFYNLAAVLSIAVGVGFMLISAALCYCRYKQSKRHQRKQLAAEMSDPRVLLALGVPGPSGVTSA